MAQAHEVDDSAVAVRRALSDAYRLLRYRPRSVRELQDRLQLRGHPSAVIHQVATILEARGELKDRQFARLWAESRLRSYCGPRRIALELTQRGVARPIVTQALAQLGEACDERAVAQAFIVRRLERQQHASCAVQWRRLSGQLARRGFAPDLIEDVLRTCLKRHP